VWTCAYTGRSGLTFEEALDSEKKAKEQLEQFPHYLQRPLLCVASLTHRSRLIDMNDDVFLFTKDRYFVDEAVEVVINSQRLIFSVLIWYFYHSFIHSFICIRPMVHSTYNTSKIRRTQKNITKVKIETIKNYEKASWQTPRTMPITVLSPLTPKTKPIIMNNSIKWWQTKF